MREPRRILLLEDDPDESLRAREALAGNGYMVLTVATLAAAKQAVTRGAHFDLVFVDQNLPDGEGLALIPHLRSAGVAAPVVLVTGNRSEQVSQRAFRAGCADLAIKDLDYHLWLPTMAQAFILEAEGADADFRWGPHVLGLCTGRLNGSAHAEPAEFWSPLAGALQSATDLAIRGMRATGQSPLASLPVVHLQLRDDRHLVLVLRGGVFAAAVLTRAPNARDTTELAGEAAMFARARSASDDASPSAAA